MNAIVAAATVAIAFAAPSAASAWEWPNLRFWDDGEPDALAPPSATADETPVTLGTGWYLRGDLGIAGDTQIPVGNVILPKTSSFPNNYALGLGFGYKYNNWLRSDITVDYRAARVFNGNTTGGTILCQDGAVGTPAGGAAFTGSAPVYGNCLDYVQARMNNVHALFNVYADLGTWYGLTPYVGAGIGFNMNYQRFQRNWYYNNGNPYSPTVWTDPYTKGTYENYWDTKSASTSYSLAWALMGGAAYNITNHLAIDVGVRYVNLGSVYTSGVFGSIKQSNSTKEMRVGFRYTPD
ncbi:MAG: porin family protein [Hyphomicrobiales bacterium]|nr:porin family protein [Hyphomicrobiales bacterium]